MEVAFGCTSLAIGSGYGRSYLCSKFKDLNMEKVNTKILVGHFRSDFNLLLWERHNLCALTNVSHLSSDRFVGISLDYLS